MAQGRYEIKTATMVDLIRTAYGFDPDKILGGPNWLEMNRYDIIAKLPPESTPDSQKLMLQALLADRFKLVTHQEKKPMSTFALLSGKKHQLKPAEGSEQTGCRPQTSSGPVPEGGGRLMMSMNGEVMTINMGPGGTITYQCRNMTMDAFAANLRSMIGAGPLGANPVLNETALEGKWNFDMKFSFAAFIGGSNDQAPRITVNEAVEKQLGLKLEERQVPTPVMVVDGANAEPTPNSPQLSEIMPVPPPPMEFEVASVKPTDVTKAQPMMSRFGMQAGGRFTSEGMPLSTLVNRAFNVNSADQLVGLPSWASSTRFDVIAKAPSSSPTAGPMDMDLLAPMLRSLLVDRFKMTYHKEDRQVNGYSLVALKPKMKKADPNSRTFCKNGQPPPGAPPATRVMTCQNITMAQFVERLQNQSPDLQTPVLDATGLEGGWDFTLTYTFSMMMMPAGGGRGGAGADPQAAGAAADPTGGYTIFEAVEKELGLKLEQQKRTGSVIVIDHLEEKPTEN